MGKKKVNVVYSTNSNYNYEFESSDEPDLLPPNQQTLKVHFETKHRAGKKVTVVTGFVGPESDLKELGKLLKSKCATGGSVKDNEILIQGQLKDKVKLTLQNEGYKVKG
jgi:translation initiation factor 1